MSLVSFARLGGLGLVVASSGCGATESPRDSPRPACDPPSRRGGCEVRSAGSARAATRDGGTPDATQGDGGHLTDAAGAACADQIAGRFATLLDDWPVLTRGRETRSFSSVDRTGRNSDGFTGAYSELYVNDAGEHVIFDAMGPGVLDTLWFTGPDEGGEGLDLGTVRFYFDDELAPSIALPWTEIFRGDRAPFLAPLVADNRIDTGAFVSWVPMAYARRLTISTEKKAHFYQAHYTTLPPDVAIQSFAPCALPSSQAFQAALDFRPQTDVEPVALDVTRSGEGTLDVIQFEPAAVPTEAELSAARIRIAWDGEATPSVDTPLGSFFGSGLGPAVVRAIPFSMEAGLYESRFRMPFWSGFHLTVTGLTGTLRIHVAPARYSRADAGHFHAHAREERPTTIGRDFEWVSASGAGKLVGTVLTVHPVSPTTKRWWEGDLRSYANGLRTPGLHGTGHEDDHLAGWSNTLFAGPFTLPLSGEPTTVVLDEIGQINANTTLYRFYPGIEFIDGIRHSIEHGSRNGVSGDYGGVAFYYSDESGTALVESDRVTLGDEASRVDHAYVADGETAPVPLSSSFEGRDDGTVVSAITAEHIGVASFDTKVSAENSGCFLRRLYDQQNGRQQARIRVDGSEVGTWYTAESNTTHRWAERDYFLPRSAISGRATVRIDIEPTEPVRWSAAEYRLLCIVSN